MYRQSIDETTENSKPFLGLRKLCSQNIHFRCQTGFSGSAQAEMNIDIGREFIVKQSAVGILNVILYCFLPVR